MSNLELTITADNAQPVRVTTLIQSPGPTPAKTNLLPVGIIAGLGGILVLFMGRGQQ